MSDNKSKDIWDRIKEKGWNYNTTSAITTQELALITSDEFNSLNETEYQNRSKIWKGLKTFDEFKYFTEVDNINAANKDSNGNRIGGFDGAKDLESITLPSSLKVIGDFAFNMSTKSGNTYIRDTKLKHISGGENVEKIGYCAFQSCSALTEFNFSDKLKEIGVNAFNECYSLQKAILPETVTVIHRGAFADDSNLTNIGNMHNVKYIGDNAFDGSSKGVPANRLGYNWGLLGSDGSFDGQMPNLEELGMWAFQLQVNLTELYMPKLRSIGPNCFNQCWNLKTITASNCVRFCETLDFRIRNVNGKEFDNIPDNCIIKNNELILVSSITEWTFNDDETRIPSFFLYEASNLSSVTISNSVTSAGRAAFYHCSNLENIKGSNSFIGSDSTDIASLFEGCKKLKELDLSNCDFSGITNYPETNGAKSGLDAFTYG